MAVPLTLRRTNLHPHGSPSDLSLSGGGEEQFRRHRRSGRPGSRRSHRRRPRVEDEQIAGSFLAFRWSCDFLPNAIIHRRLAPQAQLSARAIRGKRCRHEPDISREPMNAENLPAREAMEFDVVIVGAGPAGLAAAIRLKQISPDIAVVVVEKGSEVGAHILSGAVIDPIGLDRLLPDWRGEDTPIKTAVSDDRFYWLGAGGALRLPNFLMPPLMNNHGNYVVSLGNVCRWLATKAEALGVEIYPGFAAAEVLFDAQRRGGRRRHRRHGHRQGWPAQGFVHARHGAARQIHAVRRRRARQPDQDAAQALRSRRRPRAAEIRHRAQGALAGRAREAPLRPGAAHFRLAARQFDRRRLVPLSLRRQSGVGRLRRSPQLFESIPQPVRGVPALQDASARARDLRGRQAAVLWRARHHRGRLSVGAEARVSGRRADRLRGGLRQRAAHQGQPQRDPVRHARGRACRAGAANRPRQ